MGAQTSEPLQLFYHSNLAQELEKKGVQLTKSQYLKNGAVFRRKTFAGILLDPTDERRASFIDSSNNESVLVIARAECSYDDQFERKEGRNWSSGRLFNPEEIEVVLNVPEDVRPLTVFLDYVKEVEKKLLSKRRIANIIRRHGEESAQ